MFWLLAIVIAAVWIIQSYLSFWQARAFSRRFIQMRRRGRVAMGKYHGGFSAGSIVMFGLDGADRIREGERLAGVTVWARFKPFDLYNGVHIADVDPEAAKSLGNPLVKAVSNAVENYRIVMAGGEAPEPLTAVGRLVAKLPAVTPRKRVLPAPVVVTPSAATGATRVRTRVHAGVGPRADSGYQPKAPASVADC